MRAGRLSVPKQLHSAAARYATGSTFRGQSALRPRYHFQWLFDAGKTDTKGAASVAQLDERIARLEAILFLSREALSTRKLSQYANLADATEARTLIRRLNEKYDQSGRAFRVEEVAGGYQLLTRPKFASWLRRLENVPKETRLSAPALETLAVIAYRQPAGRAEIEAIRGVNCGEILRQLMDRELVRIAGRSEELGRPYLYATTKRFLQLFGLRNLDELPRADQLKKGSTESPINQDQSPNNQATDSPERIEEESDVTATIRAELAPEELKELRVRPAVITPRARDEDDDDVDLDDDDTDDDDLDDLGDDDDDDDDFDDVDDEDDEDLEDDDFEEEEWEEVEDDEEEEWDDDDDEDDDWDDDDEDEDEEEDDWE